MDIIREYPCINKKALRKHKNNNNKCQIIKKNTLQEVAEFLKAVHRVNLNKCLSICLPDRNYAVQNWCLFRDIGGLP